MKPFSKVISILLVLFAILLFSSFSKNTTLVGAKLYSAEEISSQFSKELVGNWALMMKRTSLGNTDVLLEVLEINDEESKKTFINLLGSLQAQLTLLMGGDSDIGFTMNGNTVSFYGQFADISMEFLALNLDSIEVKGNDTYSAEELLSNFKEELIGHWAIKMVVILNGEKEFELETFDVENEYSVDSFVGSLISFQESVADYVGAEIEKEAKEAGGTYTSSGANAFIYEDGKIALKASSEVSLGNYGESFEVEFLAVNMDFVE